MREHPIYQRALLHVCVYTVQGVLRTRACVCVCVLYVLNERFIQILLKYCIVTKRKIHFGVFTAIAESIFQLNLYLFRFFRSYVGR